ncbi:MAG: tRNA preQ1(34) S-adenosylmethionine ribosyltransferase-isomerase QueA [Eggerthellaceae bacterium]|jgi:S-adenosylmethionine:tRNA ribosyltransferase-isomerase|nr:tRNA preQ1(34) S-adenosylmethionine ribosyltransferase-isomerase QueA [Eggerthellaceae bacterium]MDR2715956.1 tRNA preQ1(34) S-adenosylmethionine ribosyltransferase-isomerase QueA [Coriobacteriaceae bacterium]
MRTSDFDYHLPEERIAQAPAAVRDACRLLVMDRKSGALEDRAFCDILDYINPGDVLVANETRVMPARLFGTKRDSRGAVEVLLLRERPGLGGRGGAPPGAGEAVAPAGTASAAADTAPAGAGATALWEALVRPGRRLRPGAVVDFADAGGFPVLQAEVVDWLEGAQRGARLVRLSAPRHRALDEALRLVGHTPLPPYIKDYHGDEELYQTVFSRQEKSAAAPTAGLHFTPELIERIRAKGARFETIELAVGLDTFRVVDEDDPADHRIHTESYSVPEQAASAVNEAHARDSRVITVGTTSVRSLESAWDAQAGVVRACHNEATALYLLPGSRFNVVDALVTNFHVPRSTLMMLVSAFSSRDKVMAAYAHALAQEYRFLSFGDAMLIT